MFVMWNSEYKAKGKRKKEKRGMSRALRGRVVLIFCLLPFAFFLSSCRRDMQDQPKVIAYRQNPFYRDGASARPPVEGTVPRGYLRADRELYLGKKLSTGQQPGLLSTRPV